jgi:hypothetical protein
VTLKVGLLVGTSYNLDYRSSGSVTIFTSHAGGWRLETSPSADESSSHRGRYQAPGSAPIAPSEAMTADQLESQVLVMLARLAEH